MNRCLEALSSNPSILKEREREREKKRKKKEQIHSFYESIKINQQTIFFKKLLISSLYRTELQPE
jgi:hypothetical protein